MLQLHTTSFDEFSTNVDFIKRYIDESSHLFEGDSNEELIDVIKKNYRVTQEEIDSILVILEGRRKESTISEREKAKITKNLETYFHVVGISLNIEEDIKRYGNSGVLEKLKSRLSVKKSQVKKQYEQAQSASENTAD